MNNLTLHLEKLIKEKQTKPEARRRKEIIKIGTEINKIEKQQRESIKPKIGSLIKSTNNDKPLARKKEDLN